MSLELVLLLTPLLVGGLIAALNKDGVNDATEQVEAWVRSRQQRTSLATGWFMRYVINPVLWAIVKFCNWTDGFAHRGGKNGVRVGGSLYLVAIWLMLIYAAIMIVIAIVIIIVSLWILGKFLSSSNGTTEYRYTRSAGRSEREEEEDVPAVGLRGQNVYSGTNWFNEELTGRVDSEGNIYKGTNWFNEDRIGRIADDGTIYRGTSFMNEEIVGRVDEKGTLYKGSNWFNEEITGRVADDGTVYKGTNWWTEEKTGRTGQ
jgi:hypothetical protein